MVVGPVQSMDAPWLQSEPRQTTVPVSQALLRDLVCFTRGQYTTMTDKGSYTDDLSSKDLGSHDPPRSGSCNAG